jgi:hypothetical protein
MAKLKNTTAFHASTNGARVTVGHNRAVETSNDGNVTSCFLHGHKVVTLNRTSGRVLLNNYGYMTTVTRQAMNDFLGELGVDARVSFALRQFHVDGDQVAISEDSNKVEFFPRNRIRC